MASAAMASDEAYARCLLSLAKALRATPDQARSAPAWGVREASMVGLFGKSDLEDRLMQLLRPKTPEERGMRVARLGGAAAIAALALTPAVMFRVAPALAESPPVALSTAPSLSDAMPEPEPSPPPDAMDRSDSAPAFGAPSDEAAQAAEQAARDAAPKPRAHVHRHAHPAAPASDPPAPEPRVIAEAPPPPAPPQPPAPPRPVEPLEVALQNHVADVQKRAIAGVLISADGKALALADTDMARRVADEQRRTWEAEVRCALERAKQAQQAQARAINQQISELIARQTQMASANRAQLQKQLEAARAAVNDARVKEALARAQERVAKAAIRQTQVEAANIQREVERAMRDAAKAHADADSARTEL
jgi:hypothetical protein